MTTHDSTHDAPAVRGLNLRYIAALVVIAALSIGAHLALRSAIATQEGSAAEINVSGRQRMLSQRIALYVAIIAADGAQASGDDVETLTTLTELMERSHDGLVDGDDELGLPGDPSADLRAIYFAGPGLDARVRSFVDSARDVVSVSLDELTPRSPSVVSVVETAGDGGPDGLLATLDRAVTTYQNETEGQVATVLTVARGFFVVTLFALLIEGMFVFRPLIERIRRQTAAVSSARSRLQSVLDNALVGVITVDGGGSIIDVNSTAEDLLASTVDQLATHDLADLAVTREGAAALHALVEQSRFGPGVAPTEVELRRGHEKFLAHVSAQLCAGPSGDILSVVVTDETDRRRAEDLLRHEALHDSLTGMPNRMLFLDRVEHALSRNARHDSRAAVMFVDLDDFKTVNDSLGHLVGDELLVTVAERITSCMRACDTAARLGGDEFAVMVDDVDDADVATMVAGRIIAALGEPMTIDGHELTVSASIGIAVSELGMDSTTLLSHADSAMYSAKRQGKNQHRVFTSDLREMAVQRLDLKAGLSKALTHDEFALHYQPIVDLDTGEPLGLEALLRWTHPIRGPIAPAEFIPVAEETGQIVPVGWWVLEQGISDAIALRRRLGDDAPAYMSINVSPAQFNADDFVPRVTALLDGRLPPDALVFELTETAVMRDARNVADTMAQLRRLGVRIAIDDFGTGYSSLSYLHSLAIDVIKIDRSFVDGISSDEAGGALVLSMLQMARSLGLDVIAEGIENEVQRNTLVGMDCPVGQGYHFARPADIETVIAAITLGSARPTAAV